MPKTPTVQPRRKDDYYPTPAAFIQAAYTVLPAGFIPRRMLDPGAGQGLWGEAAWRRWIGVELTGVELRNEPCAAHYEHWREGDFLTMPFYETFDLIAGNPPYSLAEMFVRHSLELLAPGGYLVQLLPLGFLESQERMPFWRDHAPRAVYVSPKRPSFTGDRRTDSSAYAVFIWQQGYTGLSTLAWFPLC